MAILQFIHEITMFQGASASDTDDGDDAERSFRLVFDETPADQDEILSQPGLPSVGDLYKVGDPKKRRLRRKRVSGFDAGMGYVVVCSYERPSADPSHEPNPLDRPDERSGDFTTERKPYDQDAAGNLALTTADMPLNPKPTRLAGVFQLKVTGNRASTTDYSAWAEYLYPACAYNDAPVTIRGRTFGTATLLLRGISFDPQREGSYTFDRYTWTLDVNPAGWHFEKFPSRGLHELVEDYEALGPFPIFKGEPPKAVTEPWPLDANGYSLAADATPADVELEPYFDKDFGVFNWTSAA